MLTLIGLGIGWVWMFQRTSENSAVKDAGQYGMLSGRAALAPFITDDLLTGSKEAIDNVAIAGKALMTEGVRDARQGLVGRWQGGVGR